MSERFAVLTGDLVASTRLSDAELDRALEVLAKAARDVTDWGGRMGESEGSAAEFPDAAKGIRGGFARRGGDGWQFAMNRPALALRTALFLRARLRELGKPYATRIAVATGPGRMPADLDPNAAHGPAFVVSGRLLEELPARAGMAHAGRGALGAVLRLADHISSGWTPAQARAVALMLWPPGRTNAETARELGITQQSVNESLKRAGFPALADALALIESRPESG
ncbi:hypothetical protein [Pontibaca methylaminivorans]|uniref:hypothetical protein n=1 Tax=Pontibaca methylaminivorans TaxID=515897 RepID=UPI002FD9D3E9